MSLNSWRQQLNGNPDTGLRALIRGVHAVRLLFPLFLLLGCQPVDIGSNVLWYADHETGDFSEWSAEASGGAVGNRPSSVVTTHAHSGKYAVNVNLSSEVSLWRHGKFPKEAYYSAWFFLPHDFQQITSWTIMTFGSVTGDGAGRREQTILNLRTLPGGQIVLFLFDDGSYLQLPLAVPPAVVPVSKWFQLEVFYRNNNDANDKIKIWIDGVQTYDVPNRPSRTTPDMYLGIGNIPDVVSPAPVQILVDDVAISLSRVGPGGVLNL